MREVKSFCKEIGAECLSEEYKGVKEKLKLRCPQCGEVYYRNYDNLQQRKNPLCALCGRRNGSKKLALRYKDVKRFIETDSGSVCKLLSDTYFNTDAHLSFQCDCGNLFKTSYYKFKQRNKRQCNDCGAVMSSKALSTPVNQIKKMVKSNNYTYIDNQLGGDQRMLVRCPNGHDPYWVRVTDFRAGQRCSRCYRSMGEDSIAAELDLKGIKYVQEHTFSDLLGIGGRLLRYDFLAFINNTECLIEYDGKQHFEVGWGDVESFKRIQAHDEIKNQYAKDNSIPLYRIPYTKYHNIPYIIDTIISEQV